MSCRWGVVAVVVVVVVVHGVVAASGHGGQACGGQGGRHLVMMVSVRDEAGVLRMEPVCLYDLRGRRICAGLPGGGGRGGRAGGGHRESIVKTCHGHGRGRHLREAGVVRLGPVPEDWGW